MIPRDRPADGFIESVGDRGVWVPDGMSGTKILSLAERVMGVVDIGPYSARCIARELIALGNDSPSDKLIVRTYDRHEF